MSGSTVYTMFYDKTRDGVKTSSTRVTVPSFIAASDVGVTYLPPKMWPGFTAGSGAPEGTGSGAAVAQSPIFIDAGGAKLNPLTTLHIDLRGLSQPAYNPVCYTHTLQYVTINENTQNSITINRVVYNVNHTYLLVPGSHNIRTDGTGATVAHVAEYVIVCQSALDWTDRVALSVLVEMAPDSSNPGGSQKYFAWVQTATTTMTGVPLSTLFADTRHGGIFTYRGSDLLPLDGTGHFDSLTWYVFETPVTIQVADFQRLWATIDPSGALYAGPLTPTQATADGIFYIVPGVAKMSSTSGGGGNSDGTTTMSTGQCTLVKPSQYYDAKTGTLRASVSKLGIVPVSDILTTPAGNSGWLQDAADGTQTSATRTDISGDAVHITHVNTSAVTPHSIENMIAIIVGMIVALSAVSALMYFLLGWNKKSVVDGGVAGVGSSGVSRVFPAL